MSEKTLRKMIEQLHEELREVRYALWALEAVARGKPHRGRPPKTEAGGPPTESRARPKRASHPKRS